MVSRRSGRRARGPILTPRQPDPTPPTSFQGEPGIGPDLAAPFTAEDEATRWLFELNRKGIRPGLVRVQGLLRDLGHPERMLTNLIIAGTNGKGSTTRILACLLQAAGLRVATYTSPHLLRVYERLQVDDRPVNPGVFAAHVTAIQESVDRHQASWFETLTAVATHIAAEAGVDVFCCETGLGGRLDATNALPAAATLLTTVDLDHQHILGETREEILAEKLGLLKRGAPFFSAVAPEFKRAVLPGRGGRRQPGPFPGRDHPHRVGPVELAAGVARSHLRRSAPDERLGGDATQRGPGPALPRPSGAAGRAAPARGPGGRPGRPLLAGPQPDRADPARRGGGHRPQCPGPAGHAAHLPGPAGDRAAHRGLRRHA